MASPFDALLDASTVAIEATFGDEQGIEITPTRKSGGNPNKPRETDPAHAPVVVQAIIGGTAVRAGDGAGRGPADVAAERAAHASARKYVAFDASGLGFAIEKGDKIKLVETAETFVVSELRRGAGGWVQLDLAEG